MSDSVIYNVDVSNEETEGKKVCKIGGYTGISNEYAEEN